MSDGLSDGSPVGHRRKPKKLFTNKDVESIVNISGRLGERVKELEEENKSLRKEIAAYKDLVEFQAKNHQEELWERITKAYFGGQRSMSENKEKKDNDSTLE